MMMKGPALLVFAALATVHSGTAAVLERPAVLQQPAVQSGVSIPFEWVNRHIVLEVTINGSVPLSFLFDTGATPTIVRLDRAKQLGLKLQGSVNAGGAGPGQTAGANVADAKIAVPGLRGFSQPVRMALPLVNLSPGLGQQIDGIIGGDFIREFVVELDFQRRRLTLHDRSRFTYSGPGESVPITFNAGGHPTLMAQVAPIGGRPIEGAFMFDTGSGVALVLHTPTVSRHGLLATAPNTVRAMGRGAGGNVSGRLGRVETLRIGRFTFESPITLLAQDQAGAFANPLLAGNIGAPIAQRFNVFLDYRRNRMILEPHESTGAPFDRAFSGLGIRAEGDSYRTFRVFDILEDSPATEAGIATDDLIVAVDGRAAADMTLTDLLELLELPVAYQITLRRASETLTVRLTPRRMI